MCDPLPEPLAILKLTPNMDGWSEGKLCVRVCAVNHRAEMLCLLLNAKINLE